MKLQKTSFSKNLFIFKAPFFCANHFFPNEPHTQTFLTLQNKLTPEEELSAFRGQFSKVPNCLNYCNSNV